MVLAIKRTGRAPGPSWGVRKHDDLDTICGAKWIARTNQHEEMVAVPFQLRVGSVQQFGGLLAFP
jgi:hypothetical protein